MRSRLRRHRIIVALLWIALAVATTEGILLYYYLNSWMTLPSL